MPSTFVYLLVLPVEVINNHPNLPAALARMATHDDGINDEVPQDMVLEYDAPDLIPPEVHSTEALMDLKELRDVGRHRKIALKGNHWQHKASMKDPMVFWDCALWEGRRDRGGEFRYIRPHMTMHVKGGWQVRIDDNGHYLEDETDWIAEVERKPLRTEVAMTDLLKSAKQRKTRKKGQCKVHFDIGRS